MVASKFAMQKGRLVFDTFIVILLMVESAGAVGDVWAWGDNEHGQLGDGTTNINNRLTPVQVSGLTDVIAVATGGMHSIALKNDGTVWAWGYNRMGQLGDGTTNDKLTPVQVSGLTDVIAVAAGMYHTIALKLGGTVWAWGDYGTTNTKLTPVQVSGLTDVIAVASGYEHSIALKNDGTVMAWGYNSNGQLGDGTISLNKFPPVQVSGLTDVIAVAGGGYHTIALKSDGTVWAWGNNEHGQLGDGTTCCPWGPSGVIVRLTPVQVSGLTGVIAVAAGFEHSIALKNDGTVWAWGFNNNGQLGDGTTNNRLTPVQVSGLTGVIAVAAGDGYSIALKNDGTVWAWGFNNRLTPFQVSGLTGVTAIAGRFENTIALRGQLAIPTYTATAVIPVETTKVPTGGSIPGFEAFSASILIFIIAIKMKRTK